MNILRMFSCCIKQIDTSNYESATDLQTPTNDVLTIGNLTFNYTADGIDTQRIETIFNNINNFNCGQTQLRQLNEALNGSTIHFKKGDVYSCNLEFVSENKTKIVFTLPPNPPSELVIPCVTLPEGSQSSDITNNFKMIKLTNNDTEKSSEKIIYLQKSSEEIEAYLMGHEIFHAISSLVDLKNEFGDCKTTISEDAFKKHRMNHTQNEIEKYCIFFDNGHMDDVKNLFGLKDLNKSERIIGEFDFLQEITKENIIRFPYFPATLVSILGEIEDQNLKQLVFNELLNLCVPNENDKETFRKRYENKLNDFFNNTKVKNANEMINDVKKYHEERLQNKQNVANNEFPSYPKVKEQEGVFSKLENELAAAGYQIKNVLGDGNCGIYAILRNLGLENNQNIALRNAIFPENHRMRQDREWLGMENLHLVASYLGNTYQRDLIIINTSPINPNVVNVITPDDHVYTRYVNGRWVRYDSLDASLNQQSGNTNPPVILLYTPNHWQAVLPER